MPINPREPPKAAKFQRMIEALRWTCVPLAAWLGNYVGYILGGTLGLLATRIGIVNPPSDDSPLNRSLRYLIWMLPQGILCVVAGAELAPRWRRTTAVVVGAWWALCIDFIHGFEGPTLYATPLAAALGIALVVYLERAKRR